MSDADSKAADAAAPAPGGNNDTGGDTKAPPAAKPKDDNVCGACGDPIVAGSMLRAMDKVWHPEHFRCFDCGKTFEDGKFMPHEGNPFCPDCYKDKFCEPCVSCGEKVMGGLRAAGGMWHPDCFKCFACGDKLGAGVSFRKGEDGKIYCSGCSLKLLSPKCKVCGDPIQGEMIKAMDFNFHRKCFNCQECAKEFPDGKYMAHDGLPFCKECFERKFYEHKTCSACGEEIPASDEVTAFERPFHRNCTTCKTCNKAFGKDTRVFMVDGALFCEEHYKETLPRCTECGEVLQDDFVEINGHDKYHSKCLTCYVCKSQLELGKGYVRMGCLVCEEHKDGDLDKEVVAKMTERFNELLKLEKEAAAKAATERGDDPDDAEGGDAAKRDEPQEDAPRKQAAPEAAPDAAPEAASSDTKGSEQTDTAKPAEKPSAAPTGAGAGAGTSKAESEVDPAVAAFLAKHRLSEFTADLVALGVEDIDSLKEVEEADLEAMGMKKLQMRRFLNNADPSKAAGAAEAKPKAVPKKKHAGPGGSRLSQVGTAVEIRKGSHEMGVKNLRALFEKGGVR